MRTARKVAAALGAVALGVAAPVAFVVHGAGAAGRPDSPELWGERLRRAPRPVLELPERASTVRPGGAPVERLRLEPEVLEARQAPSHSPVVSIAERGDLVAVATFDDGVFALEAGGTAHPVEGVAAVNAIAFDADGNLCIASDDGAYLAAPGERAQRLARGPFSAVAVVNGQVWFASRGGVSRLDGRTLTRWGADHGLRAEQPTSIAACDTKLCVGAADGVWELPADGGMAARRSTAADRLPAEFVTAVASGAGGTWAGTFDGGLVRLGAAPLTPADGLPEGRISPRALAAVGDHVFAGTPSGLLVVSDRTAALVHVGGEVSAVAPSSQGGVWVGLPGKVLRMAVSEPPSSPAGAIEVTTTTTASSGQHQIASSEAPEP